MIINFYTFLVSSIIFILTPGLDTVFVMNKALTETKMSGLVSAIGIATGVLVHTLFAALGLSIILSQSATAFSVVKYAGALYLFYLGIKAIREKSNIANAIDDKSHASSKLSKVFVMATLTNTLNPKVALFFLAFFPQFVKLDSPNSSQGFITLGVLYAVMSLIWLALLSLFVSHFAARIKSNVKALDMIQKVSGLAFILLGIQIALSRN